MMGHVAPHKWADAWRGKLSESEVAAMDRHAETCARCAKARDRITRTSSVTFAAIKNAPVPEVSWDSVRAKVHWEVSSAKRSARQRAIRPTRAAWLGVAACAAAGIGLLVATGGTDVPAPPTPAQPAPLAHAEPVHAPAAPAPLAGMVSLVSGEVMIDGVRRTDLFDRALGTGTVIATADGRIDVQFGDHSAFALGPRSKLELRRFDATEVRLVVDGTIDVEVAPRAAGQRFLVEAGAQTIEVRGTQFRVVHDTNGTRVACRHGLVAVRDHAGEALVGAAKKVDVTSAVDATKVATLSDAELAQLAEATPVTTPLWIDDLAHRSSILELATSTHRDARVDGVEVGPAPLRVRVMPGRHTIETADASGRFHRAGWVDAQAAEPARLEVATPEPTAPASPTPSIAARKRELATGIAANRPKLGRCTRAAAKSGIEDLSVQIEISVDATGAVRFLNVDSDLTSVTQACIHDALAQIQFGPGPAATWHERIDL
ncbi:MAG: FecR domain-containing protein [Deltaproteobacteria bacterium]|nr:FecR domain-containing protein [Deltaproteobacteria bacterium]